MSYALRSGVALSCLLAAFNLWAEETGRVIEEMVVTAEKRQSTVSDTSISITAISEMMLEEQGIQSANEFVNFIPATTRDNFDIRIRGVGRNFRSLGGDPGVATYYNGIYSEDALIALTENALWDLERIEVLRGPQGTLYGRNSIGGAINYITKKPSDEFEGELRGQFGEFDTREYYLMLSGPMTDTTGYRINASKLERDGWQEGQFGTEDVDSTNDQTFALSLKWEPTDNFSINTRYNNRRSYRIIGQSMIMNEGWGSRRGTRSTDLYAFGIRPVCTGLFVSDQAGCLAAAPAGVEMFTDPATGAVGYGAAIRPGVDGAGSAFPNPEFNGRGYLNDSDFDDVDPEAFTNDLNDEEFDQEAVSLEAVWDVSDNLTVKYLYGYTDFLYTFNIQGDYSDSTFSDTGSRTHEEVYSWSHELTFIWDPTDNLNITAGAYKFFSNRLQDFSFQNNFDQNRLRMPANYGQLDTPQVLLGGFSVLQISGIGPAVGLGDAPIGSTISGRWDGDIDGRGSFYVQKNKNSTTQNAVYAQGTYTFNENFALTLGLRWAEDEKDVFENRGGYVEANFVGGFSDAFAVFPPLVGIGFAEYAALTYNHPFNALFDPNDPISNSGLALQNVLMGNAIATADPANPIIPVCALDDPNCTTPLRLQGVPLSWNGRAEDDDTWDDITWRINLDWTPNDDTLIYLSATTGYRAGGYALGLADARVGPTPTELKPLSYDEETVIAYELGYKGTLLDGTLQLNAAVYRYDYEGYQDSVDIFDPTQNAFRSIATNTGDAINQGFEVEITWLATDNLTINGNYSWTDTEYQDEFFLLEDDNPLAPEPLFGERPFAIEGNRLKGIPEHKATVWGSYEWRTEIGKIVAGASVAYTGEYNTSGIERPLDELDSRLRTDVSLSWYSKDEKIRVRAFVDNVFDERMYRGIDTGTAANNFRYTAQLLYPRYWGVDIRYGFGG